MKKLVLVLLCLPMISFGQDYKTKKSTFNFQNTNHYNIVEKKTISNEYYNSPTVYNFNKAIKNNNDTISNDSLSTKNNLISNPFNKGLIQIISETIEKNTNDSLSILKKID